MTHALSFSLANPLSPNSPESRRAARIELLAPIEYPADLPVVLRREELAQAIVEHLDVVTIDGRIKDFGARVRW